VSAHEFVFAVELSDGARFDAMLTDVARVVLNAAGCSGEPLAKLTAVLHQALSDAARTHARCDVRFQAHAGELRIGIACAGQAERRTTFTLPNP
jgi:hypothetical protein